MCGVVNMHGRDIRLFTSQPPHTTTHPFPLFPLPHSISNPYTMHLLTMQRWGEQALTGAPLSKSRALPLPPLPPPPPPLQLTPPPPIRPRHHPTRTMHGRKFQGCIQVQGLKGILHGPGQCLQHLSPRVCDDDDTVLTNHCDVPTLRAKGARHCVEQGTTCRLRHQLHKRGMQASQQQSVMRGVVEVRTFRTMMRRWNV